MCLDRKYFNEGISVYQQNKSINAHHANFAGDNVPVGDRLHWTDGLIRGNDIIIIFGCMWYHTMGEIHHASFCYYFRNGLSEQSALDFCTKGNSSD